MARRRQPILARGWVAPAGLTHDVFASSRVNGCPSVLTKWHPKAVVVVVVVVVCGVAQLDLCVGLRLLRGELCVSSSCSG